jgi:hypothetical protein
MVEEVNRALPRELSRVLAVARGRVVVKAVLGAVVHTSIGVPDGIGSAWMTEFLGVLVA